MGGGSPLVFCCTVTSYPAQTTVTVATSTTPTVSAIETTDTMEDFTNILLEGMGPLQTSAQPQSPLNFDLFEEQALAQFSPGSLLAMLESPTYALDTPHTNGDPPATSQWTGMGYFSPATEEYELSVDNLTLNPPTIAWRGHTPPQGRSKKVEYAPGILFRAANRLDQRP